MSSWLRVMIESARREFSAQRKTLWTVLIVMALGAIAFALAASVLWTGPLVPRLILPVGALLIGSWTVARGLLCRRDAESLDRRLPAKLSAVLGGKLLFLWSVVLGSIAVGAVLGEGVAWALPAKRLLHYGVKMQSLTALLCVQALICAFWIVVSGLWFRSSKLALLGASVLCALFVIPGLWIWNSSPGLWPEWWEITVGFSFFICLPLLLAWVSWKWMLGSVDRQPWAVGVPLLLLLSAPVAGWTGYRVSEWWDVRADQTDIYIYNACCDPEGKRLFISLRRRPLTYEGRRRVFRTPKAFEALPSSALVHELATGSTSAVAQDAVWAGEAVLDLPNQFSMCMGLSDGIAKGRVFLWRAQDPNQHVLYDTSTLQVLDLQSRTPSDSVQPQSYPADEWALLAPSLTAVGRKAANLQMRSAGLMTEAEEALGILTNGDWIVASSSARGESDASWGLRIQNPNSRDSRALKVEAPFPLHRIRTLRPMAWPWSSFHLGNNIHAYAAETPQGYAFANLDLDRGVIAFTREVVEPRWGANQLIHVSNESVILSEGRAKIIRVYFGLDKSETLFETAASP